MSCRSNRWHVCPLSLRVLHHEARTHDDVPTGNVGPGLPRAIPRNLELDETMVSCSVKVAEFGVSLRGWLRSSDIGCGF